MKSWDLMRLYLDAIFARVEEKAELCNKRTRHQTTSTSLHLIQQMSNWVAIDQN